MRKIFGSLAIAGTLLINSNTQAGSEICVTIIVAPTLLGITILGGLTWTTVKSQKEVAYQYLKENNKQWRRALVVGQGAPINDVLKIYSVPETKKAAAAEILFKNQQKLERLSAIQTLTPESAAQTFAFIGAIFEKNQIIPKGTHSEL